MNTVAYATKFAPYLVMRCLKHLGLDHSDKFPDASQIILKDFYVDGSSNDMDAVMLGKQVTSILKSGYMDLKKWVSNECNVVRELTDFDSKVDNVHFGEKYHNKALELY